MEKPTPSDSELLADWLGRQREPAFQALVARYAGLVHGTAKRTCGDDSMAAEASQLTFITLAQKAKSLTSCASLGGWLHTTALMQAKNLIRKSQRENRKRQLLQAAMETGPPHTPSDTWKEIQPMLDDALAALSDKDRQVLLLRFYRSLTIREIATTLGIATDATQKRLDRATERLRGKLARRGLQTGGTLSAAMLAGFFADAQAALPISILASKAIATGSASAITTTSIIALLANAMKSTSLIVPAVALISSAALIAMQRHSIASLDAQTKLLQDRIAASDSAALLSSVAKPGRPKASPSADQIRVFSALAYPSVPKQGYASAGECLERIEATPAERTACIEHVATSHFQQLSSWTTSDYQAAGKWLAAAPEGPAKISAIHAYAETVAKADPQVATQWALTLPAGNDREETLRRIRVATQSDQE